MGNCSISLKLQMNLKSCEQNMRLNKPMMIIISNIPYESQSHEVQFLCMTDNTDTTSSFNTNINVKCSSRTHKLRRERVENSTGLGSEFTKRNGSKKYVNRKLENFFCRLKSQRCMTVGWRSRAVARRQKLKFSWIFRINSFD